MQREHWDRVMSGQTATPSDNDAAEAEQSELIIVGAHGEETPTRDVEQDYGAEDREFIADAASERGDDELATFVKGGLKLKAHRQEPTPPKTADEVTRDVAVELAETRKQQAHSAEAELADHRLSRASLGHLSDVQDAWEQGYLEDEQVYAEQQKALSHIEAIEDDELRHATYETALAGGFVDEDLYEQHAYALQEKFVAHQEQQYAARAKQQQKEFERDVRTMDAVFELEESRLNSLSPVAQGIARSMIEEQGEAIAEMPTKEQFVALAYVRNAAKIMADSIEGDNLQADIVRAHNGPMREGYEHLNSRRERREYDVHGLGLSSDPWSDEKGRLALARAEAEVARDIKQAERQHSGRISGKEKAANERAKLAARLGTPMG